MNTEALLLRQIIIMFILMGIGFVFYKIKYITDQGSKDFAKLLLYLVIPVVVIKNFVMEKNAENIEMLISATLISAICVIIAMIISYIFFNKRDGIANFSSSFSNAGFIGIPLVSATLGENAVVYISMMIVFVNIMQWTYGVWIITGDKSVMNFKKIITNPVIIAVIIGLILFFFEIPVPEIGMSIFSTIVGLNTPLAMFVSGVYLAQSDLIAMFKKKNIYFVSIVRLVIIPFISIAILKYIPFGSVDLKIAILIAAASPVGSNVAVFANMYNKDYISAVEEVCMSTIFCLLTLPFIISLALKVL